MKKILKNKLALVILLALSSILIIDVLLNRLLQVVIEANSSLATTSDPVNIIGDKITSITTEWLKASEAPRVGTKVTVTIQKSGMMAFLYVLTLLIGLIEIGASGATIYLGKKEESNLIRKFVMTFAILLLCSGLYNIVAAIIKFSSGMSGEFEYALTQADVNTIITAKTGMEADISNTIREYASDSIYSEVMFAEYTRLVALGVEDAMGVAARNLFGDIVITNLAPKHGELLGGNLAYNMGSDFSNNITTWLSVAGWERFFIFFFSSLGVAGLFTIATGGILLILISKYRVENLEVPKY